MSHPNPPTHPANPPQPPNPPPSPPPTHTYTASGAPFFFNVETGDTTWELPAALAWTEVIESSSGADGESGSGSEAGPRYFHNTVSGEVAWSAPEGSRHVFVEASAADL